MLKKISVGLVTRGVALKARARLFRVGALDAGAGLIDIAPRPTDIAAISVAFETRAVDFVVIGIDLYPRLVA